MTSKTRSLAMPSRELRRPLGFAVLVAVLPFAVACSDAPKAAPATVVEKAPTRLILGGNEPDTLNPLFTETSWAFEALFFVQRQLTMYDDTWSLVPDLATEVPTIENGRVRLIDTGHVGPGKRPVQNMEVTWQIRPDANWEDGVPVTADDFLFAYEVTLDPTQEVIERTEAESILKMEARGKDKKTLVVTWKEPFAFYNKYRVHPLLPAHLLRPRYKKPGGGTRDLRRDDFGRAPLSNGYYRVKEWVAGQYLTLEKNPNAARVAKIDEIVIRFIKTSEGLVSALRAGDIHATLPTSALSISELNALRQQDGDRFRYQLVPGLIWSHIDFNLDSKLLSDKRVRRALVYGINRKGLIHDLYQDQFTLVHTYLPPRHWAYDPRIEAIPFDLEEAARLLAEAGWKKKGKDGILRNARGEKMKLYMSAMSGARVTEELQQIVQADLRTIGVDLVIDNKPQKVFFPEFARPRKFPHLSFYSWIMSPSSVGSTMWKSDMIPSTNNRFTGQNLPGWRNAEVDALLRDVTHVIDEPRRKAMMRRVQEIFADELPAIPMYFRPVISVSVPALKGMSPTGTQTPVSWNAWTWDFAPTASAP